MQLYADTEKTKTKGYFNPLLHDYVNMKFFLSTLKDDSVKN